MLPIYFVIGLLNIFSQHHNYGIKIDDPNFDVRVRRSIGEDGKGLVFNLRNTEENNLKRDKRYAYYKKTRITNNDIPRINNENNNNGNQTTKNNRYDIFNPNWNFLFNTTNNNRNNHLSNSGLNNPIINNRPMIINSYPYGYPPGYAPRTNSGVGANQMASTTGYQNNNAPIFYNYQNPNGKNFAGFAGYSGNKPGPVTTPVPYPPSYTQNPLTNIFNGNFPTASYYTTTSRSGIHNLPYGTNPANGVYNNNLSPYAPNFENGSANFDNSSSNFDNGFADFNNGSAHFDNGSAHFTNGFSNFTNGSVAFNNSTANFNNESSASVNSTNTIATTTERIVSGCVICNIGCPKFMRRFGGLCVDPDSMDNDYK